MKRLVEIEERKDHFFHLMRVTLPVPRLFIPPKEMRRLCRAIRHRQLVAARSLLDWAIERLEEPEDKVKRKPERVEIE